MFRPILTRRPSGEYSTVVLPDGSIETLFFPDDGSESVLVGRTLSLGAIAKRHIAEYEADK